MRPCSFAAVLRVPLRALAASRSEFLRELAGQLASVTTLEDAVAHGVHLEAPLELVVLFLVVRPAPRSALLRPRSRSRSPLSKAAPNRPRGSILRSQRGPTELSVKSCPAVWPDRSVSSHRRSCSSTSAGPKFRTVRAPRCSCRPQCVCRSAGSPEACLRRCRSKATQAGQAPPSVRRHFKR